MPQCVPTIHPAQPIFRRRAPPARPPAGLGARCPRAASAVGPGGRARRRRGPRRPRPVGRRCAARAGTAWPGSRRGRRGSRSAPRRRGLRPRRVVPGVDHDVGGVREGVGAPDGVRDAGAEVRQRALFVVEFGHRELHAVRAEDDPAVLLAADEDEADAGVVGEGRQQRRMTGVDLLLGHAVRHVREGDQAEVAGGQHDRLGVTAGLAVEPVALLHRPAQCRADGGAGLGAAVGTAGPARHGQPAARAHEVAEGEAVAALEGLAGALAVVGEDDDAVRAGACSATFSINARARSRRWRTLAASRLRGPEWWATSS